ncbi:hypothetical protein HCA69_12515 [Listeria grandensis]|uniref:Uncharacterized protein n=1 Tax=Listeria grandensis TaxID=1494963 RepID=A0A7X1CQM5_9LIST|nr:CD1375 family protein [Listeria grandensis]MBC1937196.1 hypothetical protein [Listeria grandensis]
MSALATMYAKAVFAGNRTLDSVPAMFREEAEAAVEELRRKAEAQAQAQEAPESAE